MCRVFAAGALLFSVHADPEAPIGEGEATLALYFCLMTTQSPLYA